MSSQFMFAAKVEYVFMIMFKLKWKDYTFNKKKTTIEEHKNLKSEAKMYHCPLVVGSSLTKTGTRTTQGVQFNCRLDSN